MADIYEQLESCILLLDGGFGTMVQQYGLTEEDYRGERFRDCLLYTSPSPRDA